MGMLGIILFSLAVNAAQPPVIGEIPIFSLKERQILTQNLTQWVAAPSKETLHFTLVPSVDCDSGWVAISDNGTLVLRPGRKHLGYHECTFKASDSKMFTNGVLKIGVSKDPRPPIWLSEPITETPLTGKTNVPFSGTITTRAKDLDGEKLTFSRKLASGPIWLAVSPSGALEGTPNSVDLGKNRFQITLCNEDGLCSNGTLIVNIETSAQVDVISLSTSVPGAPSELLWVIDNSDHSDSTLWTLKKNIPVLFNDLQAAQVNHQEIIVSSDTDQFNGLPIASPNSGNTSNSFVQRVDAVYSDGFCNNCNSSPIWALNRFLDQLPETVAPYVPMEVVIVTSQLDHFKYFQKQTKTLTDYTTENFAHDFVARLATKHKAMRINIVSPKCYNAPSGKMELFETTGDPLSVAPSSAYITLAASTHGKLFTSECHFDAANVFHAFAKEIIPRAHLHAKNRIPLSKPALPHSPMVVTIGGVVLAPDKWSFDRPRNEVILYWDLIDNGQLNPEDKLQIAYEAP